MSEPDDRQRIILERDRALSHLISLRRLALLGTYDEAEFDRAVQTYRAAEAAVQRLDAPGSTGRPRRNTPSRADPPAQTSSVVPDAYRASFEAQGQTEAFVPTARMRFIKWLVQTGRLSDWR